MAPSTQVQLRSLVVQNHKLHQVHHQAKVQLLLLLRQTIVVVEVAGAAVVVAAHQADPRVVFLSAVGSILPATGNYWFLSPLDGKCDVTVLWYVFKTAIRELSIIGISNLHKINLR